ncbi:hypothetical protein [Veronia nyctiphanis]|uniref:hypothetical protein n=1 Tax=Veronia nyctiphanis TaxID=1278244 RepID=UPI0013759307|nr:hypothetical protein [Veronia nyctiphanis]
MAQLYAQMGVPEKAANALSTLSISQLTVRDLVAQAKYLQMSREWGGDWSMATCSDNQK